MQSHASRHFASEHLRHLHPDVSRTTSQDTKGTAISVAYGRRALPKLLAILAGPERSAEETAKCLQALDAAVVSQEQKTEAIRLGAVPLVVSCIQDESRKVSECACHVLNKLITLLEGRQEAVLHGGVDALMHMLPESPVASARCLGDLSKTLQGAEAMLQTKASVIGALSVALQGLDGTSSGCEAKVQVMFALAMLMRSVSAISPALEVKVPTSVVHLLDETFLPTFPSRHKEDLQRQCVECFLQLSHVPEGKRALREAGAISALSKLLDSEDDKTVSMALHTFMGLSIDIESKEATLQVAGQRLVQILKGTSSLPVDLQHVCRAVLINAAEHPLARKMLDEQLPPDEQAVFLGPLPVLPFDYRHEIRTPGYVA